jgi:hypothetical protein
MTERLNNLISQTPTPSTGCLQVAAQRNISIPSPDSDREMAIRCADWKRLERGLTQASDPPKEYSTLYGILFGLSGSAGLSLKPLAMTKDLPNWVLPAYIVFTVACLFCGLFVVFFSRGQRRTRMKMISDLLDDVREIGSRFVPPEMQDGQIVDAEEHELPDRTTP